MNALTIRPCGYALGAEITGLDVSQPVDDATVAAIRAATLEHIVVRFPGQRLEAPSLREFCARFGELDWENSGTLNRDPDQAGVVLLTNKPVSKNGKRAGGNAPPRWHTDRSYRETPAMFTFLYAVEVPEVGGDTIFANTRMAYEALSPAYQQLLDPLRAIHDIALWPSYRGKSGTDVAAVVAANPPVSQPLVRVHPETGRKALFLGEDRAQFIDGLTEEETKPIVDFVNQQATRYEFLYRHRWQPGDLVMWDNRCSLHIAVRDYDAASVRRILRCTVVGDRSGVLAGAAAGAGALANA